jgi:L-alanine-DL-glutamate epimerase-like enolase superfamily enzyme
VYGGQGHPFAPKSQVVVVKLTDEDGFEGTATCLAERSTRVPLAYLHDFLAHVVLGRDVFDREAIWQDIWREDRHLVFYPLYVTGAVDVCLWDLASTRAGLPLYKYIGACRDSLPVYYSTAFMDTLDQYVAAVEDCKRSGYSAFKVHSKDLPDIYRAVRDAAGSEMVLMADPAADMTYDQALRLGRLLERLDYRWLEEPFRDWHLSKYAKLCNSLDIPIAATEATAGGPWGVAQAVLQGAVDIVRADVSWKSGVTGTLKIAHLAEACGLNCEVHSTLMGPMDIANLHVSCAISNCDWFELHVPAEMLQFPMKEPYPLRDGRIYVPTGRGLGIQIDWDSVDNSTYEHQRMG